MDPVPREAVGAGQATALRELALVVREDVVLAPGVQIDGPRFPTPADHPPQSPPHQRLQAHRGALDVPPRVALAQRHAPDGWAGPLHQVRRVLLPQQEIRRVVLLSLRGVGDAPAGAASELVQAVPAELPVALELLHVEVDRPPAGLARDVGAALLRQRLDDLLHPLDMVGGAGHEVAPLPGFGARVLLRDLQAQLLPVLDEAARVEVRDRAGVLRVDRGVGGELARLLGLEQALAREGHLVLAPPVGAGVVGHVADVGDVHDVPDGPGPLVHPVPVLHPAERALEEAAEQVGEEEGPEVPDVGIVVDRGPAGVERDVGGVRRLEGLDRSRQRVVEVEDLGFGQVRHRGLLRAIVPRPHGGISRRRHSDQPTSGAVETPRSGFSTIEGSNPPFVEKAAPSPRHPQLSYHTTRRVRRSAVSGPGKGPRLSV